MIVDCFTFFNEFDVLELRLRTLAHVVDRFVLCEAPFTFRGDSKPLFFQSEAERFAPWIDRIRTVALPGPPAGGPWANEAAQRSYLATALAECVPDDVILIGDVDEIPDPRFVTQRPLAGRLITHRMVLMRGYANRADGGGAPSWLGTRALRAGDLAAFGSLNDVRYHPAGDSDVVDGGWHFSSFGGGAVMERKLRSFSHAELDIPYFRDRRRLDAHYESAGGVADTVEVPVALLPGPLRDDPRWAPYLWSAAEALEPGRAAALEHAHGCLAYLPDDRRGVAILTASPGAWDDAARERFGTRFLGVYPAIEAALTAAPGWIVIDGLERRPDHLLEQLRRAGVSVVAFAANARSIEPMLAALEGRQLPPGRALGRTEYERTFAAAGYRVEGCDHIPTRLVPWTMPVSDSDSLFGITIGAFHFAELGAAALADFQSSAFVFRLVPEPAFDPQHSGVV